MPSITHTLSTTSVPERLPAQAIQAHQGPFAASILKCDDEALQLAQAGHIASLLIQQATEDVWDSSLSVSEFRIRLRKKIKNGAVALTNEFEHENGRYAHQRINIMEEHMNCATFDISFFRDMGHISPVDPNFLAAPQPYRLPAWKRSDGELFDRHFYYRTIDSLPSDEAASHKWGGWIRQKQAEEVTPSMLAYLIDASLRPHMGNSSSNVDLAIKFHLPIHPAYRLESSKFILTLFEEQGPEGPKVDLDGKVWTSDGLLLAEVWYLAF